MSRASRLPELSIPILVLIRSLIPSVRPLRDANPEFPEGFCDVVTAQITLIHRIGGVGVHCGTVEREQHIWVRFQSGLNIDFTAHQFDSLKPYVRNVDGFYVLVGTDAYLKSLGYEMYQPEQCHRELMEGRSLWEPYIH